MRNWVSAKQSGGGRPSMGRNARRAAPVLLALGALVSSQAAFADVDTMSRSDSAKVDIEVSARVKDRCGVSSNTAHNADVARIDQSTTLTFAFKIDCNAPFAIGASSRHGGLQKVGAAPETSNGFAIVKPYDVNLVVDTDSDTMRSAKCASGLLSASGTGRGCEFFGTTAGQGMSSRQRTAIGRDGTVTVHWNDGDMENGRRLAAGQYQDVITVIVGVRT